MIVKFRAKSCKRDLTIQLAAQALINLNDSRAKYLTF